MTQSVLSSYNKVQMCPESHHCHHHQGYRHRQNPVIEARSSLNCLLLLPVVSLLFLCAVVPPDQQCILQGCKRPKYVEPSGKVHDFCGRYHAQEYARQQQQSQGSKTHLSVHTQPVGIALELGIPSLSACDVDSHFG